MKKIGKIFTVTFTVVISIGILLTVIGGVFYLTDKQAFNEVFVEELQAQQTTAENILSLDLSVLSDDVQIKTAEDGAFKIEYFTSKTKEYDISYKDGVASFKQKMFKFTFDNLLTIFKKQATITVYIPQNFNNLNINITSGYLILENQFSLNSAKFSLTSGDMQVSNLNVENNLNINLTSGNLTLNSIESKNLSIGNTSGSVNLKDVNISSDLTCNQTSGKTILENIESVNLSVTNTSGSIKITSATANKTVIKSTSGSILVSNFDTENISCNSVSGSVELGLVGAPSEFNITAETVSGIISLKGEGVDFSTDDNLVWGLG